MEQKQKDGRGKLTYGRIAILAILFFTYLALAVRKCRVKAELRDHYLHTFFEIGQSISERSRRLPDEER